MVLFQWPVDFFPSLELYYHFPHLLFSTDLLPSCNNGRLVWVSSGSWWWTGKPGILQPMGLQTIRHNWATELNWGLHSTFQNTKNTYFTNSSLTRSKILTPQLIILIYISSFITFTHSFKYLYIKGSFWLCTYRSNNKELTSHEIKHPHSSHAFSIGQQSAVVTPCHTPPLRFWVFRN